MVVEVTGHDMFKMLLEYMNRGNNFKHTSHILFEAIEVEEEDTGKEKTIDIINLCENNVEKNVPRWANQLGLSNKKCLVKSIKDIITEDNLTYNEKYALIPKKLLGLIERNAAANQSLNQC